MVNEARDFWVNTPGLHVGPDNPTKRSFLDALQNSVRDYTFNGSAVLFCALSMACSEFSVLFSKAETQFFGDMTSLYDNLPQFSAPRSSTSSVLIERPTVNILAGVTPDFLADLLPESAWGQGFTSRLMFIYGSKMPVNGLDLFVKRPKENKKILQDNLIQIFTLNGEFLWDDDAQDAINKWHQADMPPKPDYGRLVHYVGRRLAHVMKLSMISAVSYHQKLTVHLADFERAKTWLLDAELTMPDVFKAMRQKSDEQLLQDMHQFVYSKWASVVRDNRKPVKEELIWEFFKERTTSERIQKLIETALRSGLIRQATVPGTYIPRPRME